MSPGKSPLLINQGFYRQPRRLGTLKVWLQEGNSRWSFALNKKTIQCLLRMEILSGDMLAGPELHFRNSELEEAGWFLGSAEDIVSRVWFYDNTRARTARTKTPLEELRPVDVGWFLVSAEYIVTRDSFLTYEFSQSSEGRKFAAIPETDVPWRIEIAVELRS